MTTVTPHQYNPHDNEAALGDSAPGWGEPVVTEADAELTLAWYVLRYVTDRRRTGEIEPITARSLTHQLWPFVRSFGKRPLDQLGRAAVERWLEWMKDRGLDPNTRASRLAAVSKFAGWMVDNDHVRKDFTRGVPKIRRHRKHKRDITVEQFLICLSVCDDDRERMVIWFAFGCGLRCVEISRLTVDDYDPVACELFIVGKGMNERTVPVPSVMRPIVEAYLHARRAGPVIENRTFPGEPLSANRISHMGIDIIARTGLKHRPHDGLSMHGFRAGAAYELLDACGGDLSTVRDFLGHGDFTSLIHYLRRKKQREVREAQERRRFEAEGGDDAATA